MTKIMKAVEFDKLSAKFKTLYDNEDALAEAGWWLQKKYDGCFGMAVVRHGSRSAMFSRTGTKVLSCDHILEELVEAAEDQGLQEDFVVLGEVWHPKLPFPTISGKFRQHAPSTDLVFVANDILPLTLTSPLPYSVRYNDLALTLLPDLGAAANVCTFVAETYKSHRFITPVMNYAEHWQAEGGFDGAILRDPEAGYTIGLAREGQIVKVKPLLSLDLHVVEFTETVGEKTGRAVYTITMEYRGVRTEVGSGVPHAYNDLPALGQIVRIDCLGLTADGKLREPRYIGIRHDKTESDK
jgi:ATP-dependent DNA ligase